MQISNPMPSISACSKPVTRTRVLLFDFDGTLANTFPIVKEIILEWAAKNGREPPDSMELTSLRNCHAREILRRNSLSLRQVPVRRMRKEARGRLDRAQTFPGMSETLAALCRKSILLGIVTSNSAENVSRFLERHGWIDIFRHIQSDSTLFGKARLIRKALDSLASAPADAVYVGDELRDIDAARKAGVRCAAVTWGFNSREALLAAKPDHLVDSPEGLLAL